MKTVREWLQREVLLVLEKAGAVVSDEAADMIAALVDTVLNDPRNDV